VFVGTKNLLQHAGDIDAVSEWSRQEITAVDNGSTASREKSGYRF